MNAGSRDCEEAAPRDERAPVQHRQRWYDRTLSLILMASSSMLTLATPTVLSTSVRGDVVNRSFCCHPRALSISIGLLYWLAMPERSLIMTCRLDSALEAPEPRRPPCKPESAWAELGQEMIDAPWLPGYHACFAEMDRGHGGRWAPPPAIAAAIGSGSYLKICSAVGGQGWQ